MPKCYMATRAWPCPSCSRSLDPALVGGSVSVGDVNTDIQVRLHFGLALHRALIRRMAIHDRLRVHVFLSFHHGKGASAFAFLEDELEPAERATLLPETRSIPNLYGRFSFLLLHLQPIGRHHQ